MFERHLRPADVEAMTVGDILYWTARAVDHFKRKAKLAKESKR